MLNEYVSLNNDRIAYRIIDEELVIIDLKINIVHILNPIATFICENLDSPTQIKDIVKKLYDEFDVDYKTAEKDCLDFISDLLKKNIVLISHLEEVKC